MTVTVAQAERYKEVLEELLTYAIDEPYKQIIREALEKDENVNEQMNLCIKGLFEESGLPLPETLELSTGIEYVSEEVSYEYFSGIMIDGSYDHPMCAVVAEKIDLDFTIDDIKAFTWINKQS